MKKNIYIVLIVAVGVLFGWRAWQKTAGVEKADNSQRRNPPIAVETAPVATTTVRDAMNFTGTLYPFSEFMVAPKIAGRLEKILVQIGDVVKGGQLIAVLDDAEYLQEARQAKAELDVARANVRERENILSNAEREHERMITLREKKIASESQLDGAELELRTQQAKLQVAVAQVAQKEATLSAAEVRLAYTQITLSQNHTLAHLVVGERFVDEGTMLSASKPIVSVLDIGKLVAVIHVIERDYPRMQPGLTAVVTADAFPERTFAGRIVRVAPMIKETSREARVEIEIPNEENLLKPGMFARVQIEFDSHENATVVPVAALIKRNGVQGVFLVDKEGEKVSFVPVTLGIVSSTLAEIIAPPLVGDVVTLGLHLLEDGAAISLPVSGRDNMSPQVKEK